MSKEQARQSDPSVLVVLHRAGDGWYALAASLKTNPPRILDSRTFSDEEAGRIGDWIDRHRAAEVIRVLPAGAVICRTCSLPVAEPDQLVEALQLQAEAQLAGVAPDYRTGLAVLHPAPGETSRTGIVVAWPPAAEIEPITTGAALRFAPDVAALAALLNGERPTGPLVWGDRRDGSLALALTHSNGAALRATREDGEEEMPWDECVGRILAETALSAGHTASFVQSIVQSTRDELRSLEPGHARLVLPADISSSLQHRVQGAGPEATWWNQFGIAVGALLARTSDLAALTQLELEPPRETPSLVRSTVERLSRPATAVRMVVLALLVLGLGPMALNAGRLQLLKLKHGTIDEQLRTVERAKNVHAMYRELGEQRWTMTKLLADLSNNTPLGIELEQVRITQGDSISVAGSVVSYEGLSPPEVAAKMQSQLFDSRMFEDVTLRREEVNNLGGYEFELSAKVGRPHRRVKYDPQTDFAVRSYREFLYGDRPDYMDGSVVDAGDPGYGATAASILDEMTASTLRDPDEVDDDRRGVNGMLANADPDGGADRVTVVTGRDPSEIAADRGAARPSSGINRPRPRGGSLPDTGKTVMGGDDRAGGARGRMENVPPPVTPEAVDAMTKQEALAALAQVSTARRYAKSAGETELEERLKKDFDLLMERVKRKQ
ncbi:MAG: hypothetical protein ACYTJ0_18215 [Planctomycetota bacterium]